MANIGDKSFTTQMVGAIESVIENTIGNDAGTNRFTAQVMAVDYVNSTVDVRLPGTSVDSTGFTVNGTQMPVIGDYVIVYINQSERWVDTVYRTATSSPYLSVVSGSLNVYGNNNFGLPSGVIMPYVGTVAPSGWLLCDGSAVSRTTYSALFAVVGTKAGVGNGSTTFNLPDLKDRFLAGNAATATGYSQNDGTFTPNAAAATHTHTSAGSVGNLSANALTTSQTTAGGSVAIGGGVTALPTTNSGFASILTGGQNYTVTGTVGGHVHNIGHDHNDNFSGTFTGSAHSHTLDIDHGHSFTTASVSSTSGAAKPKSGLVNFIIKT